MKSIKVPDVSPAYTYWFSIYQDSSYQRLRSQYAMDRMLMQDKDGGCWHRAGNNAGYYMPTAMFRIIPTSTQ